MMSSNVEHTNVSRSYLLSGSNIREGKCKMMANIHFQPLICIYLVLSGVSGVGSCSPFWCPINP